MDIDDTVAQHPGSGDDGTEGGGAAASPITPLDRWAPVDSRLGFPGRVVKRVLRRVFRSTFLAQADYNERMLARAAAVDEAAQGLLTRIESIERTITEHLEPGLHRVEEHARRSDKDARQALEAVDERIESGVIRVEAIERHQTAFQGDVSNDFRNTRITAATQGRQIDDIAGRLVAQAQKTPELEAMIRSEMDRLQTMHSLIHEAQQRVRQDLDTQLASVEALQESHRALAEKQQEVETIQAALSDPHASLEEARADVAENEAATRDRVARLERRLLPPTGLIHYDFNQSFRGGREEILARFEPYVGHFRDLSRVLDVGCGRGEFLELCARAGIGAFGIDADADMVGAARLRGLEVLEGDLFEYLRSLPDRDLDGLFSAQLIEHLSPAELAEMLDLAASKLRRGAPIVLETINPNTWSAMRWFHVDPSHVTPIPADMLKYLLEASGFEVIDTIWGPRAPEDERLAMPDADSETGTGADRELRALLQRNWSRIDEVLFGAQDYALVAIR